MAGDPAGPPPTRWARSGRATAGYARTFGELVARATGDISTLLRIRDLLAEGLNLAGVARVLELEREVGHLRAEVRRARSGG